MKRLLSIIVAVGVLLTTLTLGVTAASKDAYSIVKRDGKWICVDKKGNFKKNANGIYQNSNGWWKTTNGVVTFKETGVFQNENGWWRVVNSKVDFKANGIYQNQNGWWKTTNGKVTFKENGVYQNENGWWRVEHSKVDFKANSIYQNQNGWWKTTDGKVTFKENGIFKNEYGNWYVKDSKVDFRMNGEVTFNDNKYQVTDGKAELVIDVINRNTIDTLSDQETIDVIYGTDGQIISVDGTISDMKVETKEDAASYLNSAKTLFGKHFSAKDNEILVQKNDETNESFFKLCPEINGVPVLGSQIIISTNSQGSVTGLFNSYDSSIEEVNTTPAISKEQAEDYAFEYFVSEEEVKSFLDKTYFYNKTVEYEEIIDAFKDAIDFNTELIVYSPGTLDKPLLVFSVRVSCALGLNIENHDYLSVDKTYFLQANQNAGALIETNDNICNINARAKDSLGIIRNIDVSEINNNYVLRDDIRNIETYQYSATYDNNSIVNKFWHKNIHNIDVPVRIASANKNTFSKDISPSAVSLHANLEKVFDYYKNNLGQNSFDDRGCKIIAYSDIPMYNNNGIEVDNASFSSNSIDKGCFTFSRLGNTSAALDIVGHEYTHGVISYKVKFLKIFNFSGFCPYGESGALSEGYPDIMGILIEGKTGDDQWLIGEDSESEVRSMKEPSLSHYSEYNGQDAHVASGILRNAVYRMMTDSRTASINTLKWSKVLYYSLDRLSAYSGLKAARGAIIASARSQGFNAFQIQAIKDAFDAVGVFGSDSEGLGMIFGGHRYNLIHEKFKSFEEAEEYCESLGGHMAVIETPEEDKAVYIYMKDKGVESAFLGMYEETEGVWVDVLGNSVNSRYTNWGAGEPNNVDGKEWIIQYYSDYPNGQWNDLYWGKEGIYTFIIEWDHK